MFGGFLSRKKLTGFNLLSDHDTVHVQDNIQTPPKSSRNTNSSRAGSSELWQPIAEKMLRRKPSKIEVAIEDKEELEEARKRAPSAAATSTSSSSSSSSSAASSLLQQLDRSSAAGANPASKSHRIGLSS
ncbi:hypothetical protein CDL15_Pgr015382 [Punica granatum]|uniref:Uncharacterized protein n=1 Tax=Punica granatum TaxID=22663 RepID=A0A218VZE6_PUNGR|nr:hypothetical protein CDL15_Pgr015382 [Punica granatum]